MQEEQSGTAERSYLQAVFQLTGHEARSPVSVQDVQDFLEFPDDAAERCCDHWTNVGALAWSARGHVELTHIGLTRAVHACAEP